MDTHVLEQYLVKLGWSIDGSGLMNFQGALRTANRSVESLIGGSGARLLGWQGAATGAFIGMGSALAGLVDKVALADQNYRLFALRMFTTQAVGRELSITMKALGASLDQIVWDPELHARAMQLFKDQEDIVKNMGVGFEYNMRSLRDLRFEFQRLGVILQYGSFQFVSDLFEKLFPQFGNFIAKFHDWNDWLIQHLPEEADRLSTRVVGAIREIEDVGKHLFDLFEEGGNLLIHTIGIVSGDKSLKDAKLNWTSIGRAMTDAFQMLGKFVVGMTVLETEALRLMNALEDFLTGHPLDAVRELNAAKKGAGTTAAQLGTGAAVGGIVGGSLGGPFGAAVGAGLGAWAGSRAKGWWNYLYNGFSEGTGMGSWIPGKNGTGVALTPNIGNRKIQAALAAAQVSYATGVPANVIWDQWAFETKGFTHIRGKNNLAGFGDYGGKTVNFPTLDAFVQAYTNRITKVPGIHSDIGFSALSMDVARSWKASGVTPQQYAGGMAHYDREYRRIATQVHIANVNITVPPTMKDDKQIARFVRESMQFDIQKNMAQVGGGPYQQ